MQLFYSQDYVRAAHAFDTTRKAQWIAESLEREPVADIELVAPEPATEAQVREIHDEAYVTAIRTGEPRALAESQEFVWDAALWPTVLASTGGVIAAARAAVREGVAGSLSSGLHHAKRGRGDGYCTFNGLALAAKLLLREDVGVSSVLILDLDAHCGGGTHSLIQDMPGVRHADVAVDPFDFYTPTPPHTLRFVRDAAAYLPSITDLLAELEAEGTQFGLCLYNAGMDPYEGSNEGKLPGITRDMLAERERMVFAWLRRHRIPVAFALAGGYTGPQLSENGLVALHRLTIVEAATQRA